MAYCPPKKNSIEDCSDDDLGVLINTSEEKNSTNPSKRRNRKAQFRGFYQSQKTLVIDSTGSSFDKMEEVPPKDINDTDAFDQIEEGSCSDNSELKPRDQNIPKIIEELVPKLDSEVSFAEEGITEYSQISFNKDDVNQLMQDLANSGESKMIPSNSLVNITQNAKTEMLLGVENDTSDEDISDLGSDYQTSAPEKRRLRISLRNLSDSEDDRSNSTQDSLLTPNKSAPLDDEEIHTDESDIEVTDMDYYKIRHQNETKFPATEFSLSWSPTKFVPNNLMTNPQIERNVRLFQNFPQYPSIDIPQGYSYDGEQADDVQIPCKEDDFMSIEEFIEAHKTNFDLDGIKGESKVTINLNPEVEEFCDEEENTESMRESLGSSSGSREDIDYDYSEETDVSEVDTSFAENHRNMEAGEIILMEHDDLEGTIAVFAPKKGSSAASESLNKTSFKPELADLNDDLEFEEVESEQLEINTSDNDLILGETDEEDFSGADTLEMDTSRPDGATHQSLPLPAATRRLLQISESVEGDTLICESELKDDPAPMNEEVPTDDEIIDGMQDCAIDKAEAQFPSFVSPVTESSKVHKKEKNKIRKKAMKKKVSTPVVEEI